MKRTQNIIKIIFSLIIILSSTKLAIAQNNFTIGKKIFEILKSDTPDKIVQYVKIDSINQQGKVVESFLIVHDELMRIDNLKNFTFVNNQFKKNYGVLLLQNKRKFYIIKYHLSNNNDITGDFQLISGKINEKLENGERIFMKKCYACHNKFGKGSIGPNLIDNYWKYVNVEKDIKKVIMNGKKRTMMIPFKNFLKPNEIDNVILYLKFLNGKKISGAKKPEGEKKKIYFHLFK